MAANKKIKKNKHPIPLQKTRVPADQKKAENKMQYVFNDQMSQNKVAQYQMKFHISVRGSIFIDFSNALLHELLWGQNLVFLVHYTKC